LPAEKERPDRGNLRDMKLCLCLLGRGDLALLTSKLTNLYYKPSMSTRFEFRVSGFWFLVSGFGFQVSGFRFRISGFEFQVSGFRCRIDGALTAQGGVRVQGAGSRVQGSGWWDLSPLAALRVDGLGLRAQGFGSRVLWAVNERRAGGGIPTRATRVPRQRFLGTLE